MKLVCCRCNRPIGAGAIKIGNHSVPIGPKCAQMVGFTKKSKARPKKAMAVVVSHPDQLELGL